MSNNKEYSKEDLVTLFKWFNEIQWRGGKGDPIKALFCKCDYKALVDQALKETKLDEKNDLEV
jgi:hypothetical protein